MTKREIATILVAALIAGGAALWGAIYVIDHYVFAENVRELVLHQR